MNYPIFEQIAYKKFPPFGAEFIIVVPDYLREYNFSYIPKRHWRVDYAWPAYRLIVEVDGGAFKKDGGGHNRGAGFRKDIVRHNTLKQLGWTVYRFLPEHLPPKSSYAIDVIEGFFKKQFGF